jgi:ribonuclease D
MLAQNELPQQLKLLLSHPQVLKVGRLVNGDLGYLQKACHSPEPFVGGIDLAKFAKDRRVIPTTQSTLADLCALTLKKQLNKNVPERISQAWEDMTLTEEQLNYAA